MQIQKGRAVETRCQEAARGRAAELGTSSRPLLCHSCHGGSAAFSFAFMAEKLVRLSRLHSPSLLWWTPLKYQQRLMVLWRATARYNWRGVYGNTVLKLSWTLKARCKFKPWSKPHLPSKNSWKEQAFCLKNLFLVPCDSYSWPPQIILYQFKVCVVSFQGNCGKCGELPRKCTI